MTALKLDPSSHDLVLGDESAFAEVSGIDEIAQRVKIRLLFIRGEWPLNTELGTPYFDEELQRGLISKGVEPAAVAFIFREVIEQTPGVVRVVEGPELSLDVATRALSVSFRAETDAGLLDYSTEIEVTA